MDLDNYKFRYEAYKNNTFDLDIVEQSLEESKITSYQYLRQFQLESTGYKRFDFTMREIYKTNNVNHVQVLLPRRWLFFIEHEFINVGKRIEYRRSEFYEKELTYNDINSRPDLFESTFLVFINGVLYTDGVKVLCKEDKTFMIFICNEKPEEKGFSINEMRDYIDNDAKVTIFLIPNVGIKKINTNAYRVKTLNKSTGIPNRTLNLNENVDYENALTFIKSANNISSIPVSASFTETGLFIDDNILDNIIRSNPNNTAIDIQTIPLRNLLTKISLEKGKKWFTIPMQDYPIAVENCLIFNSEGLFIHDAVVKQYYPNIYSIENVDDIIVNDNINIHVFYYENIFNKLKHINMLEVYYKYMPDFLEKFENDDINELVKNFDPEIVDYNIKDFNSSDYYSDHFKYKIEKMKEFISVDPNNFRRYLKNLGLGNNYYYVDVSKIDLSTRIRTNNADTKLEYKEFNEEMYMFVFRNDFRSMYDKLMVHIDGIRYESISLFRTDMLDYLYVPCTLIKEDSILEIEKLTQVMKGYEFSSSDTTDIVSIDIGEFAVRNKTLYNDLFVIDKETNQIVSPEAYQIILPIKLNVEDKEGNIILDYLISESNKSYYYLKGIEEGYIQLIKQNYHDIENPSITNYLRVKDDVTSKVYQLDIKDEDDVDLKELKRSSHVIDYIKSNDNMDINYQFKVIDGKVKIQVVYMNDSDASGTVAYGGLDIIDLGEVFLQCPREINIKITDENYINKDLILAIKKNFNVIRVDGNEITDRFQPIVFNNIAKPDKRYFRMYRNGKLVPRHISIYNPRLFHEGTLYYEVTVLPGFEIGKDDIVHVEYMPYMMKQVCYLESIPKDEIVDLTGLIDKPFDLKWYDIYLNGRKLVKKDIEIISANKIKILKTNSLRWLEIIENSRDKEYFGYKPVYDIIDKLFEVDEEFRNNVNNSIITENMLDTEIPVIDEIFTFEDYLIDHLYKYLIANYGFINPDENQISQELIATYFEIMSDTQPFELNPDIFGMTPTRLKLTINPDETEENN